jgi:hypothetical protein
MLSFVEPAVAGSLPNVIPRCKLLLTPADREERASEVVCPSHHRRVAARRPISLANGGLGQHMRQDSFGINPEITIE